MRTGFTLVEMVVVTTILVLMLALAVPSLSSMSKESRFATSIQMVSSAVSQAYYLSVAETSMVSIRFMPTEWVTKQNGNNTQSLAIYQHQARTDREVNGRFETVFEEYFDRTDRISPITLPQDIWVAPLESLSDKVVTFKSNTISLRDLILDGQLHDPNNAKKHYFELDADRFTSLDGGRLLNADDFLLIFDPATGLWTRQTETLQLRGYNPVLQQEMAGSRDSSGNFIDGRTFKRYYFSGLVFYQREPFLTMQSSEDRQKYLQSCGRHYLVNHCGGGLEASQF